MMPSREKGSRGLASTPGLAGGAPGRRYRPKRSLREQREKPVTQTEGGQEGEARRRRALRSPAVGGRRPQAHLCVQSGLSAAAPLASEAFLEATPPSITGHHRPAFYRLSSKGTDGHSTLAQKAPGLVGELVCAQSLHPVKKQPSKCYQSELHLKSVNAC